MNPLHLPIALCLLLLPSLVWAQDGAFYTADGSAVDAETLARILPPSFDLFDTDDILELDIRSDFRALVKNKFQTEYQPATLQYYPNDSLLIRRSIRVKARGNSRREICTFPPLKINFKQSDFILEDLQALRTMKMVSYCNRGKAFEAYLLKEYLIYRLLNLLTPASFRARLVRMTYIDTGRKDRSMDGYAILLEPVKTMEKRLGAKEWKDVTIHPNTTRQEQMAIVDVFEWLIGNYDWSVIAQHNIKLFRNKDAAAGPPFAVPYDFDYCGLVDAHYAIPPDELSIKSVRERLYRGFCRSREALEPTRQLFIDHKEAMFQVIRALEPLDPRQQKRMLGYLDEGFRILENPKVFYAMVQRECREE